MLTILLSLKMRKRRKKRNSEVIGGEGNENGDVKIKEK